MNTNRILVVLALSLIMTAHMSAQNYDTNGDFVQTFVGSGFSGYVDGTGVNTMFSSPSFVVADSQSNLFVWDSGNLRIRKITPSGVVSTFAGGGNQTSGFGTNVGLPSFGGMTIDRSDTIWAGGLPGSAGGGMGCIIRVGNNGSISRTTNLVYTYSVSGGFQLESGMCVDSATNLYYTDFIGNRIYRYHPGTGTTEVFAGSGNSGYADGNGIFTAFYEPAALSCDQADNIYVWDSGNQLIRKIDQQQNVTTFAGNITGNANVDGLGTNAVFHSGGISAYATYIPQMCCDNLGNVFLACRNCVRKIDATTNVVTMAGSFTQLGYTNDVAGNLARFNGAIGICLAQGMVFISDSANQRIRNITFNPTSQVVSAASLQLSIYPGVQISGIVGRTYQIQSSPDMSAWTTRGTILLTASPYLWIDQNSMAANRFYRVLLLP